MHETAPWDDISPGAFASQKAPVEVDVAIVGGGITGITTAYMLMKNGLRVVVLERNHIGHGATGATTAFLTQYIDTIISDLVTMFGEDTTKIILYSHVEAIDEIEALIDREHLMCDFQRCPIYVYANEEREIDALQKEMHLGTKLGLSWNLHTDSSLGFQNSGYLSLLNQAKFHPLKYLFGLASIIQKNGVTIFEETEVTDIEEGDTITLRTNHSYVVAKHVVIATYAPLHRELFFKKAFYTTYVLELACPHGAIPLGIYEDTLDPYHYLRVDSTGTKDRILIGGEDHRSDIQVDDEKCFTALSEYAEKILGGIPYTVERRWQGPIIESIDGLAWIGAHGSKNMFYATGFSGNGMTYSMIAAHIITDAITGKQNQYAHLYRTDRVPTIPQLAVKGINYTNELMGGAVKDYFVH